MFALPNAKRVRREDLDSPSSSRASSPGIDILEKLRAATQFEFETTAPPQAAPISAEAVQVEEEEELAFNLFAPVSRPANGSTITSPAQPQTIRLRSPTPPEARDPGFLVPKRDESYYFTGPVPAAKQAEYEQVAVTGETITAWSKRPCPGCAYPWKVIAIPASAAVKALDVVNAAETTFLPEEERGKRKGRLGKKARIKKRIKAEKVRVRKEEAEKGKEEKERLEREKRARRNREKKFKKRARDKAKKAAVGAEGGEEGDVKDDGDDEEGSGGESE